jgi:hypothetical protein
MAGIVSVRLKGLKTNQGEGQRAHDARTAGQVPNYVDVERTEKNQVLLGEMSPQILKDSLFEQSQRIRKATRKAPRKDANFFLGGILTFDKSARELVNRQSPDALAEKFVNDLAAQYGVKVIYLVRHSDESTIHYHFLFENINEQGRAVTNKLNRQALARLQDKAGEVFSEIGLSRGIKKTERLAKGEDYSRTVHRSVRQLHDDLPKEISVMEGLRDQVRSEIDRFAEMAPPPKPVKVEIVKERQPQGPKTEMVEVIPVADFDRYEELVQGRVALAESILAGDMVPGGELRAAKQELSGLKAEQEQTRQKFEETQRELLKTRREVGFLRRIVSWIREHFPSIFDHIPMDDLAKKNEASQPVINGGPGGIVPPGL